MNEQMILETGADAIFVAMKIASPILIASMLMGLIVSILQAATQVNEQTLSFIPKILAMTLALVISGPWVLQTIVFFTKEIFKSIPRLTQ